MSQAFALPVPDPDAVLVVVAESLREHVGDLAEELVGRILATEAGTPVAPAA